MNRKEFFIAAGISALSVSSFGSVFQKGANFESDCKTTNDILGPFYRPEAPLRQDLTSKHLEGVQIELSGIVSGDNCSRPLENALVEIWHCNTKGNYDNDSTEFHQRARWFTDENGLYSFKTILPGKYLNGKLYRPAHIHFRVTHPDGTELISQLYFMGDPEIAADPWASKVEAKLRILPIAPTDVEGNLKVTFDISI